MLICIFYSMACLLCLLLQSVGHFSLPPHTHTHTHTCAFAMQFGWLVVYFNTFNFSNSLSFYPIFFCCWLVFPVKPYIDIYCPLHVNQSTHLPILPNRLSSPIVVYMSASSLCSCINAYTTLLICITNFIIFDIPLIYL